MVKLFIFDMDGVLFDSEPIYYKINQEIYRDLNIEITDEEYRGFIGIASDKKWSYIRNKHQLDMSVEDLMHMSKSRKFEQLKSMEIFPIEGVRPLLTKLVDKKYHVVLASSSSKNIIEHLITTSRIAHYFSHVVSGEDIKRGKPEPDIFIKAQSYYDFHPGECVVIEDSKNGVLAAKAAGMKCVGYKVEASTQDLSMADYIISNYKDFPGSLFY